MSHTREELVRRAQETVARLLDALGSERLVPRFVDTYAKSFDRRGLTESPLRYRELVQTLTRESLLAMSAKVGAELPRRLTGRRNALLRGADAEAADAFREEFFLQLAIAMKWAPAELEEFYADVDLYTQMAARASAAEQAPAGARRTMRSRPAPARAGQPQAGSPFADRCALLLDPSLLDKARQAAAKFHAELERTVEEILQNTFKKKRRHEGDA